MDSIYTSKYFLITIDVEDWFQVENFKPWIPFSTWDFRELRVEQNVHRLLDLFDSIKLPPETPNATNANNSSNPINSINATNAIPRKVKATFFVLCWIAERLPQLVREIATRSHEVASHGCTHDLPNQLSPKRFAAELADSKKQLEDIVGLPVTGYRAPSFAINKNVLNTIAEAGYLYDSSYNSFSLHGRYGKITLNGQSRAGTAYEMADNFYEIPVSNLNLENIVGSRFTVHGSRRNLRLILPFGGGAYFRLAPYQIFRHAVQSIIENDGTYVFYSHPWEVDPDQPRVNQASFSSKFRHYTNLYRTETKLKKLIESFDYCQFLTCSEYLNTVSTLGI